MKLYLVGDSTVCDYEVDINDLGSRNGYGMRIKEYLKGIETVNLALSGRSSRSFLSEENYEVLKNSIGSGDYLMIGFGHNDQKKDERFSDPTKVEDDNTSFGYYLKKYYLDLAAERGAYSIICTPIARLRDDFDYSGVGGHVTETDGEFPGGNYPEVIRGLAKKYAIPLVDMTEKTIKLYRSLPIETAYRLFSKDPTLAGGVDHTHINGCGARYMAYLFCKGVCDTNSPLAAYVDKEKLVEPKF